MAKYEILEDRCVQTANCVEIAPSLFGFDDDGVVTTLKDSSEGPDEQEALNNAVRGCPALAIVHDE
ncbi:4Fe-4S single cluster domain-containing protein [Geodermatophilus amargosae]|uniref:4Fe-4S single cluster domain-containing protein n=1 Tax=Geodermatophilus amargosae TaxID=1296565 RepID=A0A1I7CPI9_9ACTN|nr:ferredoxin [Geodermatophilus amargosae]SFU01332.1 4Fe-4S single cluster domain-containing protein [Geodermatophilus amargosae]